jgi:hypothetical protein
VNLLALYRGTSLSNAHLVAVTSDPHVISDLADRLIHATPSERDPVIQAVSSGRRKALKIIRDEARS